MIGGDLGDYSVSLGSNQNIKITSRRGTRINIITPARDQKICPFKSLKLLPDRSIVTLFPQNVTKNRYSRHSIKFYQ